MPTNYDILVTSFIHGLRNLSAQLKLASTEAEKSGKAPDDYLNARLIPDMKNLVYQIQSASDSAKFPSVRLGALPNEPFEDNEQSFSDCQARIERTITFLEKVSREKLDSKKDNDIVAFRLGSNEMEMDVAKYITKIALPQFYFHLAMAYALLRMKGVDIGKRDWLDHEWRQS